MPITVIIEDEDGARIHGPWDHPLSTEALSAPEADTRCLEFIDPYGDTVFNQLQIPVLIGELQNHVLNVEREELEPVVKDLVRFVRHAVDQMHVYVRFIGD